MIDIKDYLKDPCGTIGLPYWKYIKSKLNSNIIIVHDRSLSKEKLQLRSPNKILRLVHNLENLEEIEIAGFYVREVDTSRELDLVVDIINSSYDDISVDKDEVLAFTREPVFHKCLWQFVIDKVSNEPVALGIGDFHFGLMEGSLEWIQVLPQYRNIGIGKMLVMELLKNLHNKGNFATVSFQSTNNSIPEKLYRSCGFVGDDLYHIGYK